MLRLSVHTLCELTNSGDTNAGKALLNLRSLQQFDDTVKAYHIQNSYRIPTPSPLKEGVEAIVWWIPDQYVTALVYNYGEEK